MRISPLTLGVLLLAVTWVTRAQVTNRPVELPLVREVKQLGDTLAKALNEDDLSAALSLFETNCLVAWCNAEITQGHAGVRSFRDRFLGGPARRVESFGCEITVDDSPRLLAAGAVVLCSGELNEQFKLMGGRKIDLQGRWTATLIRHEDHWLVAALHLSNNTFNNSILNLAKQASWFVGLVGLLAGAVAGWILGRKKSAATASA